MNPFDRIREYRSALLLQIKDTLVKPSDTLTYEEHYKILLSFLKLLETDLKTSEYEYVVERINPDRDNVQFINYDKDNMTVQTCSLGENLLLFQPLFAEDRDIYGADIDSLAEALQRLKEAGRIEEDVLIIPPDINVLRARLADPNEPATRLTHNNTIDGDADDYDKDYTSMSYDTNKDLITRQPLKRDDEDDACDIPF